MMVSGGQKQRIAIARYVVDDVGKTFAIVVVFVFSFQLSGLS